MEQLQESVENEVETTETEVESGKVESVRESVLKAIQENTKDSPDEGSESVESIDSRPTVKKTDEVEKVKDVSEDDLDPDLSPPARLDAKSKQVFNNLPKTLKRAFSKSVRDLEAVTTRGQQELAPLKQRYGRIDELLAPHRAEWAQMGLADEQAVGELLNTHVKLKNEATKEATFRWLAHNTGLTHLLVEQAQGPVTAPNLASDPYVQKLEQEIVALQHRVNPIVDNYQQTVSHAEAQEIQTAQQEVHQVQNERDASGRYRYPRLHEPDFVERMKPLVVDAVRNIPSLGYGNALRKVYEMFEAPVGISPAQNRTSLPSQSQNQFQQNRSSLASSSVRGRSALPAGSSNGNIDIPPEARGSARDTVAWVIANRGR